MASTGDDWKASLIPDGLGYRYTVERRGVLWASGWVRAAPEAADPGHAVARSSWYATHEVVLAIGKAAEAAQLAVDPSTAPR